MMITNTTCNAAILFALQLLTTACSGEKEGAGQPALESIDTVASRYTRLDQDGSVLSSEPSNARCVRDSHTGLIWELKTDDGGAHDKDNSYRWGGAGAETLGRIFFDDWNQLLDATNKESLCGFDDWRLPTIDELKSLVVPQQTGPTISIDYFPLTLAAPYWSASAYEGYPEHGQNVHFGSGDSYYYNGYRGNPLAVRLVRGTQ